MISLKQAAESAGKTKPAILKAIKSGRISAHKNDRGEWEIDPAELHRVYPPAKVSGSGNQKRLRLEPYTENGGLQVQIEALREERERERHQLEKTIEDLRRRLDEAEQERRQMTEQLTGLLTHQQKQKSPQTPPQGRIGRAFAVLFGKA